MLRCKFAVSDMFSKNDEHSVLINQNWTRREISQHLNKSEEWTALCIDIATHTSSLMHQILWTVKMHNNLGPTHVSLTVLCYFSQPGNSGWWSLHVSGVATKLVQFVPLAARMNLVTRGSRGSQNAVYHQLLYTHMSQSFLPEVSTFEPHNPAVSEVH